MEEVLGQRLMSRAGFASLTEVQESEFILLYFSASWCPPCRHFTPRLLAFYNEVNRAKQLAEVILVSRDREEAEFHNYYSSMPWLAIPFTNQSRIQALAEQFHITSIPVVVLLDTDGNLAYNNCKADVEALGPAALAKWRDYL